MDFAPDIRVYWRYDLDTNLLQLVKDQTVICRQEAMTIDLLVLELCGMVITAFVTKVVSQYIPETKRDPALLRRNNVRGLTDVADRATTSLH